MGERLARCLLEAIDQVRQAGLPPLDQRGETLYCWREEIALISRQAYGFRNFENHRRRVKR